jgi:hypothetical protein
MFIDTKMEISSSLLPYYLECTFSFDIAICNRRRQTDLYQVHSFDGVVLKNMS